MAPNTVRFALTSLCLSMLMSSLDTSIANAGLPVLAKTFSASFQAVQWIVLAYLLAITTLIVTAGRLGDLAGRRRLLLAGIGLFTAASGLCGLAPSLPILVAARGVQGLGAAAMMALSMAFVSETVPKDKTGRAMGLLGTMSAVGTTLGPSLGGVLLAAFGWRAIFLVNVPLGLLNLFLAYRFLPADVRKVEPERAPFDLRGMLAMAFTLAAYALSMTLGRGRFGPMNGAFLLAAVVGVLVFVRVETSATAPILPLAVFRDKALTASLGMNSIVSTVMMSTLVAGPFYLSRTLGLEPALAGLVLSAGPLVAALAGIPAGRMVDRFGAARVTVAGLAGMATGCLALSIVPASLGIPGYLLPIVCLTSSYALFHVANNTSVLSVVRPEQRGVISGLLSLSRNLGLVTGASVMGAIFAAAGMQTTFAVASILVISALTAAVRKEGRALPCPSCP